MVYRFIVAIVLLAAGATGWNLVDARAAYSAAQRDNQAARSAWQKDINNTRASMATLQGAIRLDTTVAMYQAKNDTDMHAKYDALKHQADEELGTMRGVTDSSEASDLYSKVLDADTDFNNASSQLSNDRAEYNTDSDHLNQLLSTGAPNASWNSNRYVKNEIAILAVALAALAIAVPVGKRAAQPKPSESSSPA